LKKLANRCFALARATTLESKQFQQLAWLAAMETQNLLANGKLAACEKMLMDSFPLVKSSGDREAISLILSALSIVSHMFGRYDEMRARCVAALEVLGNEPYRSAPYVHYLVAQAEFSLSRPREARAVMEECRRKASEVTKPDDVLPMYFTALEAGLFTRMMDWATAQPLLEQGVAYGVPATAPPTWCPDYLMDACISMWEHLAASGGQTAAIARQTGRVLRAIRFRAWIHPLHQGTYLRACGRVAWLKGNREKAMKFWRQGLKASEKLSRFFEQGLCHYEIGRRSPAGSTDRRSHLEAARLIFAQCKTTYNLDQVDALLADRGDA
jgi:hypothetical protein